MSVDIQEGSVTRHTGTLNHLSVRKTRHGAEIEGMFKLDWPATYCALDEWVPLDTSNMDLLRSCWGRKVEVVVAWEDEDIIVLSIKALTEDQGN